MSNLYRFFSTTFFSILLAFFTYKINTVFCSIGTAGARWPRSYISVSVGQFPTEACSITNVILASRDRTFYYNSDKKDVTKCNYANKIWSIQSISEQENKANRNWCRFRYEKGYMIVYRNDLFRFHYDILFPLFIRLSTGRSAKHNDEDQIVIAAWISNDSWSVDWRNSLENPYYSQALECLSFNDSLRTIGEGLENEENYCFKSALFGTTVIDYDKQFMYESYRQHIIKSLFIKTNENQLTKVALIIDDDLVGTNLPSITILEPIKYSQQQFRNRIENLQQIKILIAIGPSIIEAIYLNKKSIAVHLIPFGWYDKDLIGLVKRRGNFIEWRGKENRLITDADLSKLIETAEIMFKKNAAKDEL